MVAMARVAFVYSQSDHVRTHINKLSRRVDLQMACGDRPTEPHVLVCVCAYVKQELTTAMTTQL